MSNIEITKCDGVKCDKKIEHKTGLEAVYHRIIFGGSDFECSLGVECVDFCSIKCMTEYLFELQEYEKEAFMLERGLGPEDMVNDI